MARIILKEGANRDEVAAKLREVGITMKQRLADGSYVAFINRDKWLLMQYPDLAPLFAEDRAFWKAVRKRTRNGETVPQTEIEAHAKEYNRQFELIISKYENRPQNPA